MSSSQTPSPRISPDLAELLASGTDADLLKIIASERDRSRDWADAALMELHRRHVAFLHAVCQRICNAYLNDSNKVDDLLNRTMWRVFHTAERFVPAKTKCNGDAECLQHAVRCWMARKARWLAKDIAQRHAGLVLETLSEPDSLDQFGQEDDGLPECSEEMADAINSLTPRDQHIVRASFFFLDCETGNPVSPDENVDGYLARRWGTTPENIRQIRSRALKKLRESPTLASSRSVGTR